MFRRNLAPIWVGIILLSSMFLMGQAWAQCVGGSCTEWDLTGEWEALDTGTCTDITVGVQITKTDCYYTSVDSSNDHTECEGPISGNTVSLTCTIGQVEFDCILDIESTTSITGECDVGGGTCTVVFGR
jgi:hypothetical protein